MKRDDLRVLPAAAWVDPLGAYLSYHASAGRPAKSTYLRSYQLRRFSRTHPDPHAVTLEDLIAWIGDAHPDWSPAYRRTVRATLRGFYSWMHTTGRMTHNPAALLPVVKAPLGLPRPISEADLAAGMMRASQRVRFMMRLAAHAGLRSCEIAVVHSRDLRGTRDDYTLLVHGKGRRERLVPISNTLAADIRACDGYAFPGDDHGHLSAGYVSKLISWALPAGVTGHQLRHRFATQALRGSGGNLRIVQELLGHSSVATTQIYTAVDRTDVRAAATYAAEAA